MELTNYLRDFSRESLSFFERLGLESNSALFVNALCLLLVTLLLTYSIYFVSRRLLRISLIIINRKTNIAFLRFILSNRVPHFLSLLIPLVALYLLVPIVFHDYPKTSRFLLIAFDIYLGLGLIWMFMALVKAGGDVLKERPGFNGKPIDSYVQVIRIACYILAAVILFSNLTGKSPITFFTAMGAVSAILLLMFKDVILGFVASIQVTSNDMVQIGDWITMEKYGADGDVLEINLTTVKVQNFDKTITTIPTYALISDSFQNWRGMRASGGRRIRRAIYIKQASIRFLTEQELADFSKIQLISPYIQHRQKDIDRHNLRVKADKTLLVNGRNLTNAGLFRKYIDCYIREHSGTNTKMPMVVRQLAPSPQGLPIEVYVFANSTVWTEYEHIMADIFDHIIASAPYFGLQIFELEAGGDQKNIRIQNQ